MSGRLPEQLGIEKRMVKEELSIAFGFMLERTDGQAFPFDAVTYYTGTLADKVGYVTLFRMGNAMRANIFAYWPAKDATTKDCCASPLPPCRACSPAWISSLEAMLRKARLNRSRSICIACSSARVPAWY